jgi:hypothetical protein
MAAGAPARDAKTFAMVRAAFMAREGAPRRRHAVAPPPHLRAIPHRFLHTALIYRP